MLPKQIPMDALWGYLHNPGLVFESLTFHADTRGNVTVTARRRAATTPKEAELMEKCALIAHSILKENRRAGEHFAASATSFAAMCYGADIGQSGAKAKVIEKLFSAAKWWGPGPSGWHASDETWLCKDKKNTFGVTTEEQGRLLWRLGNGPAKPRSLPVTVKPTALAVPAGHARGGRAMGIPQQAAHALLLLLVFFCGMMLQSAITEMRALA